MESKKHNIISIYGVPQYFVVNIRFLFFYCLKFVEENYKNPKRGKGNIFLMKLVSLKNI